MVALQVNHYVHSFIHFSTEMKIFFILWKQHYFCLMMCGLFVIFCFKFTCLPLLVKNFCPLEFVLNPPTDTLFWHCQKEPALIGFLQTPHALLVLFFVSIKKPTKFYSKLHPLKTELPTLHMFYFHFSFH